MIFYQHWTHVAGLWESREGDGRHRHAGGRAGGRGRLQGGRGGKSPLLLRIRGKRPCDRQAQDEAERAVGKEDPQPGEDQLFTLQGERSTEGGNKGDAKEAGCQRKIAPWSEPTNELYAGRHEATRRWYWKTAGGSRKNGEEGDQVGKGEWTFDWCKEATVVGLGQAAVAQRRAGNHQGSFDEDVKRRWVDGYQQKTWKKFATG